MTMKKILTILFAGATLASCVDTIILPDDKTVEEDFWKTESDVEKMVKGAYTAFASQDVQERLIVWNSRSDEYTVNTQKNNSNLNQIYSADIQTNNTYASWGGFYTCINRCNQVLDKSASVMDIDPNYLEGDHNNNVGQMLALRSMCYFYLIRAFHDVPLVLEPYKVASQPMNVEQVAPGVILNQIINDLEDAKGKVLSSQDASISLSDRIGYFTQDAVLALLADVYLWKASVYRDKASYTRCIELCDQIQRNRKGSHGGMRFGNTYVSFNDDDYYLLSSKNYYDNFESSCEETILNLRFNDNTGLCTMYYKTAKNSNDPYFYTNNVYSAAGTSVTGNYVFLSENGTMNDVRAAESVLSFGSAPESGAKIRKFVAQDGLNGIDKVESDVARDFSPYATNFILYRITDIMLMKSEALVQKARLELMENDNLLTELASATTIEDSVVIAGKIAEVNDVASKMYVSAAHLAGIVNQRAARNTSATAPMLAALKDSTGYAAKPGTNDGSTQYVNTQVVNYNTLLSPAQNRDLEIIIMGERARELCFEGKRWYDMMRFNYRHTKTPANYDALLVNQAELQNYSDFLSLISRKYTGNGGQSIVSRISTEPYLYMPIQKSQMDINPNLVQNPVYKDNETSSKN